MDWRLRRLSPQDWQASPLNPDPRGLILQAQLSQALEDLGVQKQRADTVSTEWGSLGAVW